MSEKKEKKKEIVAKPNIKGGITIDEYAGFPKEIRQELEKRKKAK